MKVCISSGHGKHIRGASGSPVPPQLDEVNEARRVVETVAEELRARGATVLTFHDDVSDDQSENLHRITDWHNSHVPHDLDISVHFNAFDHSAHGVEVLYVTQEVLAADVSKAIASAGGFTNRGAKYRSDLYVLNNTREPAILIEVCFCDNTSDSNKYNAHYGEICEAIAVAVMPEAEGVQPEPPPVSEAETPDRVLVLFQTNHTSITCTVFGGKDDPNDSAYDGHRITDTELGCALPYKWRGVPPPRIQVRNIDNGKTVFCEVVDVGPWNTDDIAYVLGDERPQAESGTDMTGRPTNLAGIDLTPGAAKAIGIEGKGNVSWAVVRASEEIA